MKILHAKNLLKKDMMGKADPYVKIQLVKTVMSKTTTTKLSTLNPVWNETFKLLVQDPKSQSLELQVFDWEKVRAPKAQCSPSSYIVQNKFRTKSGAYGKDDYCVTYKMDPLL